MQPAKQAAEDIRKDSRKAEKITAFRKILPIRVLRKEIESLAANGLPATPRS